MSHQTGNGKIAKPIGFLHCQVQKAENCQPILSWVVPLISSSCWCVKLLSPSFLLWAPKDQLLFLLAWGSPKQSSSDEPFCTAASKHGDFLLHILCSCGQSCTFPNFFILESVHISGSGSITESWIEYCSCIAARGSCLGADTAIRLQFHVGVRLQKSVLAFASQNILLVYFQH